MTKKAFDIRVDLKLNFKTVEEEVAPAQNDARDASPARDIEDAATPAPRGVRLLEMWLKIATNGDQGVCGGCRGIRQC